MDRVKKVRKIIPASLVAIATLTVISFSRADDPDVRPALDIIENSEQTGIQQAVGVSNSQSGMVQQVVGKQPKSRNPRPGLLEVLAGAKPKGSENHEHPNMPKEKSKGLLDVLFNKSVTPGKTEGSSKNDASPAKPAGRSNGKVNSAARTKQPKQGSSFKAGLSVNSPLGSLEIGNVKKPTKATASSTKIASKPESIDWDGIPYHSASNKRSNAEPAPIRDPIEDAVEEEGGMRIIRGGSRTIAAKSASARQPSEGELKGSSESLVVPQPPRDVEPIPASAKFSTTTSSRRRNRRSVEPLKEQLQADKTQAGKKQAKTDLSEPTPSVKVNESGNSSDNPVTRVATKATQDQKTANGQTVAGSIAKSESVTQTEPGSVAKAPGEGSAENTSQIPVPPAPVSSETPRVAANPKSISLPRVSALPEAVPSRELEVSEPSEVPMKVVTPLQASEPQTAVAAIGVPSVAIPAIDGSPMPEPLASAAIPVPEPASPSALPGPPSVAVVPSPPADTEAGRESSITTFPKITANIGAPTKTKLPAPVREPQVSAAEPAYTTPVVPTRPRASFADAASVLGPPAAVASHRAGPPGNAFDSTAIQSQAANSGKSLVQATPIGSGIANRVRTPLRTNGVDAGLSHEPHALRADGVARNTQSTTPSYAVPTVQAETGFSENFSGNPNRIATNFNRTSESTNRMRKPGQANLGLTNSSSELPGIRVATFGPSEVTIRQVNEYEIRVENRGAIDARGVIVRASIPDWADMKGQNVTFGQVKSESEANLEYLVWTIERLPAGTSEKMFIRLVAARSGSHGLDVDWTMQPQRSVAQVRVHEPKLDLSIDGPEQVIFGMSQTYKVRVLNSGDGTAPNVVFTLSPNSATPQIQRIGDIPAGKEAQFDVELIAQDLGDLKIHGLVSGDLDLKSESSKVIRVAAAQLEAVLSGPQLKYQNTEAMYGLQLQNNGTAASDNIIASLRLPAGVKYLGGMEGVVAHGNLLRWRVNSLKPGTMQNYQFRCQMASTGEHVFAFDCAGTAAGATEVSIATRVESIADLVLTVADPPAPAPVGSDVTYEILIRNRGSKEATNVRAVAQFGHGIEPQRIEGHTGDVVPGQVMFNPIPRIGPGAEVRLRVIAQAEKTGHHRFRAEVHSGDTMLVAEEATHYMSSQSDRVSRRSSGAGSH